ncbi:hypothetical protein ACIGCZ_00865 [Streptomyces nigra]|uniref:hypothetical protein n=1 Tax=Streptomyces nigra TaxID=1827580 RepID=UPI0037CD5A64
MPVIEVLLWAASVWAVFLAFAMVDVPTQLGRVATHLRQQQLPHWARHGHVPPDDEDDAVPHGRHRAN